MEKTTFQTAMQNLKRNWCLPFSMMAFFWLGARVDLWYAVVALAASLIGACLLPPVWDTLVKGNICVRLLAAMTSLGICWANYTDWNTSIREREMQAMLPISPAVLDYFTMFCTVAALLFVYVCVVWLYQKLLSIAKKTALCQDIRPGELAVYAVLLIAILSLMSITFLKTDVFYGTEYYFDNIYTSDSPILVKENAYLALSHAENDIRQPLFAVFASPFLGIPNLICEAISASAPVRTILLNGAQIVLLMLSTFLLARMMKLSPVKRVCFMLLSCSTYPYLLFELMMEQYIIAYFWLILFLYLVCEQKQPDRFALWGAGGTLLTSMILIPFMSEKTPWKDFKGWFMDMVKQGLGFVGAMFLFFRVDVIFSLAKQAAGIGGYAGAELTVGDKFLQYTEFLRNCFLAPNAGVDFYSVDHVSWKMLPVTEVNLVGLLILLLAIVSAVLNRDKKSSQLAALWVGFSVALLFVMGWGTAENGLLLYALYFGWALLVLLFQLVESIENRWNVSFLIPAVSILCVLTLAAVNIPAILEMVNFGITYYPV